MKTVEVGVLGATGTVGGRLVRLLNGHPWFRLTRVAGSPASAGARLGDVSAPDDSGPLSAEAADLALLPPDGDWGVPLILSSIPSPVARTLEEELAGRGHMLVSNASAFRMDPDVPLVVPDVNPDHLSLLDRQGKRWAGGLVTNPNCSVAGLVVALAPLHPAFGVRRVMVTSMQAISGAGRPGPASADLLDNVIPFIPGEEEKLAAEPGKILGALGAGGVEAADFTVSAAAHRVAVSHGHLLAVSVALDDPPGAEEAVRVLSEYRSPVQELELPSQPLRPVVVLDGPDRPQPRLDRNAGKGMSVTVGRVRECPVLDLKMLVLSHNLVRGAAGAALLNAELCHARSLFEAGVPS